MKIQLNLTDVTWPLRIEVKPWEETVVISSKTKCNPYPSCDTSISANSVS